MTETMVARWRRSRGRRARVCGLMVFAVVGLTACSSEPVRQELRTRATSPEAESRRAVEEKKLRALIERMTAVKGLKHVLTRLTDSCDRPHNGSLFENNPSPYTLTCGMSAAAHFGVQGDITDVLPRIRAVGIAVWGPQDSKGRDLPHAGGTVAYALDYHRDRGRYPDSSLMPAPTLESAGLRIDWDRPDLPLPNQVGEPSPCPTAGSGIYHRCSTLPEAPMSMAAARARYGTVLTFSLGGWDSSAYEYVTVPRRS